jgi:hypothetical protein
LPDFLTPRQATQTMQVNRPESKTITYRINPMTNLSSPDNNPSEIFMKMKLEVFKEHLRQTQHSFNLSVVAFTTSIGISVIGACLIISGKATEGTVTTATGLFSTTFCTQLARQSSERLEELTETLQVLHHEDSK